MSVTLMFILASLPSLAFVFICFYAVVDAQRVEVEINSHLERWDKSEGKAP